MYRINKFLFPLLVSAFLVLPAGPLSAQTEQPLTDKEFVNLLYGLPRNPQKRDELIEEIRRRGIGSALDVYARRRSWFFTRAWACLVSASVEVLAQRVRLRRSRR